MTSATASIDELLRYEEEPSPPQRRPDGVVGWTVKAILMSAGLTALIAFGLRLAGVSPPYPLVFSGLLSLLALRRVVARVAPAPPPRTRSRSRLSAAADDGLYSWGVQDALQSAPRRWDSRLNWSKGEPERFRLKIQPALREIVDERLRLRHGFTLDRDPARARAVLGEPLWALLTAPPTRLPGPREFAGLVGEIERLDDRGASPSGPPPRTEPRGER
jgi:hypothetical protein